MNNEPQTKSSEVCTDSLYFLIYAQDCPIYKTQKAEALLLGQIPTRMHINLKLKKSQQNEFAESVITG